MGLEGNMLFGVSLDVLSKIIGDIKSNPRMNELLKGKALENTALIATDKEFGFFALNTAGLTVQQEKEFIETLKPILEKHMPAKKKPI